MLAEKLVLYSLGKKRLAKAFMRPSDCVQGN
jgi:hypothetical protein